MLFKSFAESEISIPPSPIENLDLIPSNAPTIPVANSATLLMTRTDRTNSKPVKKKH